MRDSVTYQFRTERRYRLRHVERVRLGTPYPDVVAMLRQLTNLPELARRPTVAVTSDGCSLPKRDLMPGVQVLLGEARFSIAQGLKDG